MQTQKESIKKKKKDGIALSLVSVGIASKPMFIIPAEDMALYCPLVSKV